MDNGIARSIAEGLVGCRNETPRAVRGRRIDLLRRLQHSLDYQCPATQAAVDRICCAAWGSMKRTQYADLNQAKYAAEREHAIRRGRGAIAEGKSAFFAKERGDGSMCDDNVDAFLALCPEDDLKQATGLDHEEWRTWGGSWRHE